MEYTNKSIHKIVENQREYFYSNETLDIGFRIKQLKLLKQSLLKYQDKLEDALKLDLNKSDFESYLCDIGPCIIEINEAISHLRLWARTEIHFSGLMTFPSIFTRVYKMPYGVTLIISPFNFPVYLTIGVLTASLAAGNTAVIKTSSKSYHTTSVLKEMIQDTFDEKYVTLIDGGHDVADMCLNERFDKIFYTGSPNVAKHVLELASKNLTPVALELGGETGNFAIIRKDADLKDAAKKIAFFKLLNAGQICININQIAVAKEVADEFIQLLEYEYIKQASHYPLKNDEYPKMINKNAFDKCMNDIKKYKRRVIFGGNGDESSLKIEPTIIYPVNINDEIVQRELFSPILPIVEYEDDKIDELLNTIQNREHPLALYLFTSDVKWAKNTFKTLQYGGGCLNEVCVHIMVKGVPFNGTGHSGMGAYHGVWGFREFSHPQTVLFGKTKGNLSLRYHPYNKLKKKIVKLFER